MAKAAKNSAAAAATAARSKSKPAPTPLPVPPRPLSSDDEQDDDESGEDDDEEDDVTPEALERMMALLEEGDLDPAELAMLAGSGGGEDGSDSEEAASDDDEEGSVEDEDEGEDAAPSKATSFAALAAAARQDDSDSDAEDEDEEMEEYEALASLSAGEEDVVPVAKTVTNDKTALLRVLERIKQPTTFFDTLSLTYPTPLEIPNAEDDLTRELQFYKQSLYAALHSQSLFLAASLPFHRPADYFAEMLKSDTHMARIRQGLLDEQAGIKASEDARKLRDAKKFGKKVQMEKLRERERSKKELGERVEGLKKKRKNGDAFGSTEDFDIALEDAISGRPSKKPKVPESQRGAARGRGSRGMSRQGRDSKFGFGNKPDGVRRPKENNDKRDGDAFGGRRGGRGRGRGGARGGGGRGGGGAGGGRGSTRLGKSRRK